MSTALFFAATLLVRSFYRAFVLGSVKYTLSLLLAILLFHGTLNFLTFFGKRHLYAPLFFFTIR